MARDYARERGTRRYNHRRRSNAASWRWLTAGLILGLLIAGLIYLKENSRNISKAVSDHLVHHPKTKTHHASKAAPVSKVKAAEKTDQTETQFDFYTVLPKMSVETPNNSGKTAQATEKLTTHAPSNKTEALKPILPPATPKTAPIDSTAQNKSAIETNSKYILRLAAIKNYEQADQIKAELTMQGFDVSIQRATIHNEIFYRINIGPYQSRELAIEQQKALSKQNMTSTVIKIP